MGYNAAIVYLISYVLMQLSIPFMGYLKPFCSCILLIHKQNNFQFPLWDTSVLVPILKQLMSFFQFPLWDRLKLSYLYMKGK